MHRIGLGWAWAGSSHMRIGQSRWLRISRFQEGDGGPRPVASGLSWPHPSRIASTWPTVQTKSLFFRQSGDQSTGQHILDLPRRKTVPHSERRILGEAVDLQRVFVGQRVAKTGDAQRVVLLDGPVVV